MVGIYGAHLLKPRRLQRGGHFVSFGLFGGTEIAPPQRG